MLSELISKESVIMLAFGIVVGVLYYNFYLAPRDAFLYGVAECMNDKHSRLEYDRCAKELRADR